MIYLLKHFDLFSQESSFNWCMNLRVPNPVYDFGQGLDGCAGAAKALTPEPRRPKRRRRSFGWSKVPRAKVPSFPAFAPVGPKDSVHVVPGSGAALFGAQGFPAPRARRPCSHSTCGPWRSGDREERSTAGTTSGTSSQCDQRKGPESPTSHG